LAVVGVTNYFRFADGELERTRDLLCAAGIHTTVVGNLEFRINQPNKDNEQINIHVLFDPSLSTSEINTKLGRLRLVNTSDSSGDRPVFCVFDEIKDAGHTVESITVEVSVLRDWVEENFDADQVLVAGCPSGYGSFRPRREEGRGAGIAMELDKRCHIMLGSQQDRDFYANADRFEGAVPKAVLQGSDAHSPKDIGRRFSWVKAKPTFDGLRQLMFEPLERISFSHDNPALAHPKPYFSAIALAGELSAGQQLQFRPGHIALNSDLVTVIGGRGTGKSVLFDTIRMLLQPTTGKQLGDLKYQPPTFEIELTKQDGVGTSRISRDQPIGPEYLHVRQGELQEKALKPELLSREIRSLLPIAHTDSAIDREGEISALLRDKEELYQWTQEVDENGNKINSPTYNEQIKRDNEARVATLTNEKNRALVTEYNQNRKSMEAASNTRTKLIAFGVRLRAAAVEFNKEIEALDLILRPYDKTIPPVNVESQIESIESSKDIVETSIKSLDQRAEELLKELRGQGIEQDPKGLLDKVETYQREIAQAKERSEKYKEKLAQARALNEQRSTLVKDHLGEIHAEADRIAEAFATLKRGQEGWSQPQISLVNQLLDGIEISGSVHFDIKTFYAGMEPYLNMRRFRASADTSREQRLQAKFGVDSVESLKALLAGEQVIDMDDQKWPIDMFVRESDFVAQADALSFLDYLYKPSHQRRYLQVRAGLTYQGKPPEKLSVGQRGTFFLCMKLATDPFGSPFVFDQPEDDLDNEFIVKKLIPIFREIKKYRQVIIATHNANLVVNADAEQIVIAHNDAETLRYETGAIEEAHIRTKICEILEGGEIAFRQRELKYGLAQK
jgi:ABC-type lipoprotein export system ATPase subunit